MRLRPSEGCHGNSRWRASTPTPALRTFFFWGQVRKKPSRGTNASFSAEPEAEEVPLRAGTRTSAMFSTIRPKPMKSVHGALLHFIHLRRLSSNLRRRSVHTLFSGALPKPGKGHFLGTSTSQRLERSPGHCLRLLLRLLLLFLPVLLLQSLQQREETVRSSCGAGASMICNTSGSSMMPPVPRLQASGGTSNSGVGRAPWGDAHGPSPCRASRDVPPRPWPSSVPKGRCEERTRPGPSGSPSAHGASATKPAFAPPPRGSRVVRNISHVARQGLGQNMQVQLKHARSQAMVVVVVVLTMIDEACVCAG